MPERTDKDNFQIVNPSRKTQWAIAGFTIA